MLEVMLHLLEKVLLKVQVSVQDPLLAPDKEDLPKVKDKVVAQVVVKVWHTQLEIIHRQTE